MLAGRVRGGWFRFAAWLAVGAVLAAIATGVILAVAGGFGQQRQAGGPSPDINLLARTAQGGPDIPLPAPTGDGPVGRADQGGRPDLTALTGTLTRCGDEYCVNGIEVDFGPPWYLRATEAPTDYDGDGEVQSMAMEIDGLVEGTVTLTVEYGRFGDAEAFAINGVFYRNEIGPPPWAGPPEGEGPPAGLFGSGR